MGDLIISFSNWIWGTPMLIMLLGGGMILFFHSGFIPFRKIGHAIRLLSGKYDNDLAPGQITSFQALSSAIAATVGLGNISGVAIAINMGGPGAIFWMWVSAFVGMATKYYTCSLAIMFRGKDSSGEVQGGPMYVIEEGMGKKWKFLSVIFCTAGILGLLAIFQANQLTAVLRAVIFIPAGLDGGDTSRFVLGGIDLGQSTRWILGVTMMSLVAIVILGGIKRIAAVASKMVPFMVVLYFISVLLIVFKYMGEVPAMLWMIVEDAFTGEAIAGGAVGAVIITGARRAAFSNEAGIGTAPMVHGASKNNEPIREGLIAMLGPFIDTIVVCTLTALVIMLTGVWQTTESDGVRLTLNAFEMALPGFGKYLLMIAVLVFALSTMFTYSYYGHKCFNYLFGAKKADYYNYFYLATIVMGAVASLEVVISLVDGMYAIMAIPTMISTIYLAPKVKEASKDYFKRMKNV
ncbi:AGCS family alanine or glycine:cation symporter [Algoriphagus iocasae]|uniref:AGCS family alanine or glycine:cation symporter n=1 Tax=Algoriphagus iocasae TaxID=1836499 RepID=A0A841N0F2_9BACT|nr:alanine/glycine:cation symporter family protein [Algoriphagus iocasae]MBB6328175.1 AGCS family alanine or glycine:cation symporter [Algoriphagus iocasae]